MEFMECLKSAVQNIFSNKIRTILTMLGIIIGISSVILVVSIGNGSQAQIQAEFDSMTTGAITLSLASSQDIESRDILYLDDVEMLKELDEIKYITPNYSGKSSTVKLLDPKETKSASVIGVTADALYIKNPTLLYGKYISQNDVDMQTYVAVIEDTTAIQVFGYSNESVIGQTISIKTWKGTKKFTVVGITENADADGSSEFTDEYPEDITIPISTAMVFYTNKMVTSMDIIVSDMDQLDISKEIIIDALEEYHGNIDGEKYVITDSAEMVESINSILSYVTVFISFVAGISLLVGGIGVMNIMMVTVKERTREIGIRKSIGAKNSDIRIQFLTESVILSGMGGLIGLVIGYASASLVGYFIGITPAIEVSSVLIAVGISMAVGIVFGVTPANSAAMLNPIEALRYE